MEQISAFLKAHYQYVFIVGGVLYALCAYFNLLGINQYSTSDSGKAFKRMVFENWGEQGYRVLNVITGVVLAFLGATFLVLS